MLVLQVLSIKEADFSWAKQSVQPTLENINLTINKGELVGILGRVGAGKVISQLIGFALPNFATDEPVVRNHWRHDTQRRRSYSFRIYFVRPAESLVGHIFGSSFPNQVSSGEINYIRILSATVRDNILFSHEYDETFYNLVVEGHFIYDVFCDSA